MIAYVATEIVMLSLLLAITMIGSNPPDPKEAAAAALNKHDYRLAGVSTVWGSMKAEKRYWRPYGLKCSPLPDDAYAYGYFVSDAVAREAFDGYRRQIGFLVTYNNALLKSGMLPREWNCTTDNNPKPLG
jgi:hypothetical protein